MEQHYTSSPLLQLGCSAACSYQHPATAQHCPRLQTCFVQEVLQRLRQRRMSRLSHSQHEIEGILQCSEPEDAGMSDSADELNDPAGQHPAAAPHTEQAGQIDQPDMEDMGALAHELHDAGVEERQRPQQPAGEPPLRLAINQPVPALVTQHHLFYRVNIRLSESGYILLLSAVFRLFGLSMPYFKCIRPSRQVNQSLVQLHVWFLRDRCCSVPRLCNRSTCDEQHTLQSTAGCVVSDC